MKSLLVKSSCDWVVVALLRNTSATADSLNSETRENPRSSGGAKSKKAAEFSGGSNSGPTSQNLASENSSFLASSSSFKYWEE